MILCAIWSFCFFFPPNKFYLGQVGHVTLTFSLLLNFLSGHQGAASKTARYMKPENSDVRYTLTSLQWGCVCLRVCFWPSVSLSQYTRFLNSKRPINQRSHQAIEGQTWWRSEFLKSTQRKATQTWREQIKHGKALSCSWIWKHLATRQQFMPPKDRSEFSSCITTHFKRKQSLHLRIKQNYSGLFYIHQLSQAPARKMKFTKESVDWEVPASGDTFEVP